MQDFYTTSIYILLICKLKHFNFHALFWSTLHKDQNKATHELKREFKKGLII